MELQDQIFLRGVNVNVAWLKSHLGNVQAKDLRHVPSKINSKVTAVVGHGLFRSPDDRYSSLPDRFIRNLIDDNPGDRCGFDGRAALRELLAVPLLPLPQRCQGTQEPNDNQCCDPEI